MRTFFIAAAIAITTAIVATAGPAEARYIAPDLPWQLQAFCQSGC